MATERSTKRSSESSGGLSDADSFELPVDQEFQSEPPLVSLETMEKSIAVLREEFSGGIPSREERLRQMVDVEFKL